VAAMQDSQISSIYRDIARKTAAKLATKARDHSAAFPNIVIQNN
jgi:ATP-binding protein involved in chromosome partitioning